MSVGNRSPSLTCLWKSEQMHMWLTNMIQCSYTVKANSLKIYLRILWPYTCYVAHVKLFLYKQTKGT